MKTYMMFTVLILLLSCTPLTANEISMTICKLGVFEENHAEENGSSSVYHFVIPQDQELLISHNRICNDMLVVSVHHYYHRFFYEPSSSLEWLRYYSEGICEIFCKNAHWSCNEDGYWFYFDNSMSTIGGLIVFLPEDIHIQIHKTKSFGVSPEEFAEKKGLQNLKWQKFPLYFVGTKYRGDEFETWVLFKKLERIKKGLPEWNKAERRKLIEEWYNRESFDE